MIVLSNFIPTCVTVNCENCLKAREDAIKAAFVASGVASIKIPEEELKSIPLFKYDNNASLISADSAIHKVVITADKIPVGAKNITAYVQPRVTVYSSKWIVIPSDFASVSPGSNLLAATVRADKPGSGVVMLVVNKLYIGVAKIEVVAKTPGKELPKLLPPTKYSPTGEWSDQDILDFIAFEGGKTLQWQGCTPELLAAKAEFDAELSKLNWSVTYSSAYRPLIYQAHFYDIKMGDASKTAAGKADAERHGLASAVAYPNPTAPHTAGLAFDATVVNDKGVAMNSKSFVNSELLKIANSCGLNVNVPGDYVHFKLQ